MEWLENLQEEYNVRYDIPESMEEFVNSTTERLELLERKQQETLKFISWMDKKMDNITTLLEKLI